MTHWLKGERGTGLLEIMVALGILGFMGVGFMSALSTSTRATSTVDVQVVSEKLAREVSAEIMRQPWNGSYSVTVVPPGGYTFSITTDTAPPTVSRTNGSNLQRITVSISRGGKPALSVVTYRHQPS